MGIMDPIYVSLDLETTGLDPRSDEIIEIGAVQFAGKEVLQSFQTLVKPSRLLPYRTQLLTGINPEDIEAAPLLPVVLSSLMSLLGNYPVVGHSLNFDLDFLSEAGVTVINPVYDTYELAGILLPMLADHSLAAVAEELGISYPTRHRAIPDAMAAKEVFLALLEKASALDISVIAEMNRLARSADWPPGNIFSQILEKRTGGALFQVGEPAVIAHVEERAERMEACQQRILLDSKKLEGMLGSDGVIARAMPGFEYRSEQVQMMSAVACALNEGEHLIVEAGTGTGKSVAYLLPAGFFAVENGIPVVISTNTINLQEQLVSKDIPFLVQALQQESLPTPRYAQVKGRSNYLCLRRFTWMRGRQSLSLAEVKFLLRTTVWSAATNSGDRAEIMLRGDELYIWDRICASAESCLGAKCDYQRRGYCFLHRARRKAENAHLIVVNHALLLSDMAADRGTILPAFRHLIIDEAHHLEEEASEQWGFEVSRQSIEGLLVELNGAPAEGLVGGFLAEVTARLRACSAMLEVQKDVEAQTREIASAVVSCRSRVAAFFDALWRFVEAHTEERGWFERKLRLTAAIHSQQGWADVELTWENLSLALNNIDASMNNLSTMLEPLSDSGIVDYEGLMVELDSLTHRGAELKQLINSVVFKQEKGVIYWVSLNEKVGNIKLCAAPLHVGDILERHLFSQKECVVLTGATLSTEGSFDYMRSRLGLAESGELLLGSPFDYTRLAMVYVPDDIPEPGQAGYQKAVERILVDVCRSAGGRTLALFTSHAALRASHEAIHTVLQADDILVLGQGIDGSSRRLLQTFRSNPRTVLMGTSSFWEGVDVVGEALSVLVMARLPFGVPTDPVFAARAELFEQPFNEYAVPQAVLRFKQGFGRLIRSKNDRGIMIVLDTRLKAKWYGKAFLGSLPSCRFKSGPARNLPREVAAWLRIG